MTVLAGRNELPSIAGNEPLTLEAATMNHPVWCNAHEVSNYADGLAEEHTHRGVQVFAVEDRTVEVDLIQVITTTDVDAVTVIPVDDEPHVTIIVDRGVELYSGVFQGELSTMAAALGAFSVAMFGLVAK